MSVLNNFLHYWNTEAIKKTILDEEYEHMKKYGFNDMYIANELNYGYLFEYYKSVSNKINKDLLFIHSKNTINLLFTDYSIRISCPKSFINNIPFFKNILSGEWNQDNIFTSKYYDDDNNEVEGALNIVLEDTTLDCILFEKPYEYKYIDYDSKWPNGYKFLNIKLDNFATALLHSNKIIYERNTIGKIFRTYTDEYDY